MNPVSEWLQGICRTNIRNGLGRRDQQNKHYCIGQKARQEAEPKLPLCFENSSGSEKFAFQLRFHEFC